MVMSNGANKTKIEELSRDLVNHLINTHGVHDSVFAVNIQGEVVVAVDYDMSEVRIPLDGDAALSQKCSALMEYAASAFGLKAIKTGIILVCDEVECEVSISDTELTLHVSNLDLNP